VLPWAGFETCLAQAYVHSGQHRRALALLRAEKLTTAGERFMHLAGLCLIAARQWHEAIELLGDGRSAQPEPALRYCALRRTAASCFPQPAVQQRRLLIYATLLVHRAGADDEGVATAAALAVLRGRVYIGLENRTAAARCFKARHSKR